MIYRFFAFSERISDGLFAYSQFQKSVSLIFIHTSIESRKMRDTISKIARIANVFDDSMRANDRYCPIYGDTDLNNCDFTNKDVNLCPFFRFQQKILTNEKRFPYRTYRRILAKRLSRTETPLQLLSKTEKISTAALLQAKENLHCCSSPGQRESPLLLLSRTEKAPACTGGSLLRPKYCRNNECMYCCIYSFEYP